MGNLQNIMYLPADSIRQAFRISSKLQHEDAMSCMKSSTYLYNWDLTPYMLNTFGEEKTVNGNKCRIVKSSVSKNGNSIKFCVSDEYGIALSLDKKTPTFTEYDEVLEISTNPVSDNEFKIPSTTNIIQPYQGFFEEIKKEYANGLKISQTKAY